MLDQFRRAVLAFPDEDVLVGTRFDNAGGFEAFKTLHDIVPRPDHRATGEERAWGRRLAKRFGIDTWRYDDRTFTAKGDGSFPPGPRPRVARSPRSSIPAVVAFFDERRPRPGRLADRLRLGDGRRPGQARLGRLGPGPAALPMEFADVVRSRRMVRAFDAAPGRRRRARPGARPGPTGARPPATPRASTCVVLEGPEQTARYWDASFPPERRDGFRWPGLLDAPVLVVPVADPAAYVERYAEPDKAAHRSG